MVYDVDFEYDIDFKNNVMGMVDAATENILDNEIYALFPPTNLAPYVISASYVSSKGVMGCSYKTEHEDEFKEISGRLNQSMEKLGFKVYTGSAYKAEGFNIRLHFDFNPFLSDKLTSEYFDKLKRDNYSDVVSYEFYEGTDVGDLLISAVKRDNDVNILVNPTWGDNEDQIIDFFKKTGKDEHFMLQKGFSKELEKIIETVL